MKVLVEESPGEIPVVRELVTPLTRIGRDPGCDIVLPGSSVSRRHASIATIGEHHVLVDEQSSNGTYLNGVRLPAGRQFVLRPGDRIEIARRTITYGVEIPSGEVALPEPAERSWPMADLLASAQGTETELVDRFARELSAVSAAQGLKACLALACERLGASVGAIFVPHAAQQLEAVAAHPALDRVASLGPLARSIMASDRGKLSRGRCSDTRPLGESTYVEPVVSAAAVPLLDGGAPLGVLAVERREAPRLERADLVRLAVVAARLGEALSTQCVGDQDTRFGFDA